MCTDTRVPKQLLYTARRAFIWQAENRWTAETLQRPTESQPGEVRDGP